MHTDDALAPLRRHPECLLTLRAYWDADVKQRQEVPDADRWLLRLTEIPDIPAERLSGIHGRLIAFGYLKFELSAKDATLRYQLTPLGRSAVTGEANPEAAAEHEWALTA